MKTLLISIFCACTFVIFSQTWSDDVAEIVYNKCSKCHNPNGVGPFPLMDYAQTSAMATAMYDEIAQDKMPPWPPNNDYQNYVHDRSLTSTEKTTILDWITNGTPEGNPANTPPPPVFPSGALLGAGDLELQIPTYMSKALSNGDDYVCFALPSNLPTQRVIKSIEIVPGNREIVHHALIYIDPLSNSVTDTIGGDCAGPSSQTASLAMGYTPGGTPLTLPSTAPLKLGIPMPANSQVVFAMHYPEGSYGEYDSTKVIFHFYPPGETGIREVLTAPILQNWGMVIPPDQFSNVSAQYPPGSTGLPQDYSLLSVFPHMHLLGNTIQTYGIKPNLDTLKLIDIPHWDFEWQDFYFYKNIQKADMGTILYANGTYDNTIGNTHNPNNPPQTVYAGLNTSDEMFLVYMHYMTYMAGDENYNMDSLMNLSMASILEPTNETSIFTVYPNPFDDQVKLYTNQVKPGDVISVYVYDSQGREVRQLLKKELISDNELHIEWDGTNNSGKFASDGLYFISVNLNGNSSSHRVLKR